MPSHRHEMSTDVTERRSGRQSYRMAGMWTYPRRPAILKTMAPVPIDPGKKYLLSFWYKTRDIEEYPVSLAVQFIVRGDEVFPITYEKRMPNERDWQHYFVLLDHIPPRGTHLELAFHYRPNSKGSIFLDDIAFTEASPGDVGRFEKWRRQPEPKIRGNAIGREFAATGFFRVEKTDDRWWIVDPEGNPTWAMATDGRGPAVGPANPPTQTASFKREYGETTAAVNETSRRSMGQSMC